MNYVLNIKHPKLAEWYEKFKVSRGIPKNIPLTDKEREEFETLAIKKIYKEKANGDTKAEILDVSFL